MSDCIFCKIVSGEIPAYKVYETEKVLAFMDINPLSKGHTQVIPKQHVEKMHEVDDDALEEILVVVKKIAKAQGIWDYNILQNNGRIAHQAIMHVHFHIIPKFSDSGLGVGWQQHPSISEQQVRQFGEELAEKLRDD